MRYIFLVFALTVVAVVVIAGCRGSKSTRPTLYIFPDMERQPKLRPQTADRFFSDGMSSQPPMPGTVASDSPYEGSAYNTGKVPGITNWVEILPVPVTAELLARGQERFTIYCAACHGAAGDAKGITTGPLYGLVGVANFHDARLVKMADGQIFNTITFGSPAQLMLSYGAQVSIPDRWAIIGYVRALQRAWLARLEDIPADRRSQLAVPMPPSSSGTSAPPSKTGATN